MFLKMFFAVVLTILLGGIVATPIVILSDKLEKAGHSVLSVMAVVLYVALAAAAVVGFLPTT